MVAAESSNNSSIFTAMIPLFLFGVPITLGEILIYNVAETNYYNLTDQFQGILSSPTITLIILASGLVGILLSWPLARYCALVFKLPIKHLKSILLSVVIASLVYLALTKSMLWYYAIIVLLFTPIGYWLRNRDVIPLIFAFIFAKLSMTIFERIMI